MSGEEILDVRDIPDKNFMKACKDKLKRAEAIRKRKLKVYKFRKKIGYPLLTVLGPLCYLMYSAVNAIDIVFIGFSVIVIGSVCTWIITPKRQYAAAYKASVFPEIVKVFGGLTYNFNGKIPMKHLKPSGIVPNHDRYRAEDCFSGHYKGVKIKFSEITLKKRRSSGKTTTYSTMFQGLAILLDMNNKRFYGRTILNRNQSKLCEWLKEKFSKDLEKANLVDPEFEGIFDTYTNDQVEARYLVDPKIMERYKSLHEHYDGGDMSVSYYDSKVLILIYSRADHFEPSDIHVPATDEKSLLIMKKEIQDILGIVDYLDLYDPDKLHKQNVT